MFETMKFQKSFIHYASTYKFPKWKFGSTVITELATILRIKVLAINSHAVL